MQQFNGKQEGDAVRQLNLTCAAPATVSGRAYWLRFCHISH